MPVLELENLRKSYSSPDGESALVVSVNDFSIEAEQHVAIRGSSGSGKTTFLNLIAGILRPDSGRIVIVGNDMSGLSESARDGVRANHIGYVFQTFNLLQGYTALENILLGMMFGKGKDTARAKHLLERVGLADRMNYRPAQLSVGQQQRVALARALANRPDLILADEPTGNLDPHHASKSLDMLRETSEECGAALLLVSHDQRMLDHFERIIDFADINQSLAVPASSGKPS